VSRAATELVRPLSRRTIVAATLAAVLLALVAPLTLYVQTRRELTNRADHHADRMAGLVRAVVLELPELWPYATPKLARHLQLLTGDPEIARVVVIDDQGRRVDIPPPAEIPSRAVVWADAPVYRGDQVVAHVWVALDTRSHVARVILVALMSLVLAVFLSTILYGLPLRVVGGAAEHIDDLLEMLEGARKELETLNEELEARVERRSAELEEAFQALRKSDRQLKTVAARAAEATEQERIRVARELHDGAGQILTGIRLSLQVLRSAVDKQGAAVDRIALTEGLVDQAIDEVRDIAMGLRQAALDRLGLVEAIGELCDGVKSSSGLDARFSTRGVPEELPAAVETALYRLVQECVNNTLKYADASSVSIELDLEGDQLRVRIEDDGVGFDVDSARRGMGLRNMSERVALLSGRLDIESELGQGTIVLAEVPLDAKERASDFD